MSILTKSTIYEFGRSSRRAPISLNESLSKYSKESPVGKTTIFLSHKHSELKELEGAIAFLKKMSVEVYVDWLDGEMPKTISGETAKKLKEKIRANKKFVFLATEGAISSKWCNWELGYGDCLKYSANIAIFPIKDDDRNFTGSEYLQIYPRIEYVEANTVLRKSGGHFEQGYYVITPRDEQGISRYISVERWLSE